MVALSPPSVTSSGYKQHALIHLSDETMRRQKLQNLASAETPADASPSLAPAFQPAPTSDNVDGVEKKPWQFQLGNTYQLLAKRHLNPAERQRLENYWQHGGFHEVRWIASNREHPDQARVLLWIGDQVLGKAKEQVALSVEGNVTHEHVRVLDREFTIEQLRTFLEAAAALPAPVPQQPEAHDASA